MSQSSEIFILKTQNFLRQKFHILKLEIVYNGQHVIFAFLILTYLICYNIFSPIYFHANLTMSLSLQLEKSQVYMLHVFNIHVSADGYLNCFHFWAVVTRAAMSMCSYLCHKF